MLTSKVAEELNEVEAQFLFSLICVDHSNTRSLCRPGAVSGWCPHLVLWALLWEPGMCCQPELFCSVPRSPQTCLGRSCSGPRVFGASTLCFLPKRGCVQGLQVQHMWCSDGLHLARLPEKLSETSMVHVKTCLAVEGIVFLWSPVLTSK